MTPTVGPVIADRADLVGREREREALRAAMGSGTASVVFMSGIGGIGKTALLDRFAVDARAAGAVVIRLDGGSIEPTPRGFLESLSAATGARILSIDGATARLASLGGCVVLVVDRYEVLRPLDPWLQQSFAPSIPAGCLLVLAGREPPIPGWSLAIGRAFCALPVGGLPPDEARALLRRDGVDEAHLARIGRLARGNPLALRLAAAAIAARPDLDPQSASASAIVESLAELYLAGLDAPTREALGAASVVRRPTLTLLGAMLPEAAPQDAFDRLRALPFASVAEDGLVIHDTVRDVVAAFLRATDPDRHRRYRIAAWRQLRDEVARASPHEMWRYTADLLYILENPAIREVFFPTTEHRYFVDVARPDHEAVVLEAALRQEGAAVAKLVAAWWRSDRSAFRVARDGDGEPVGFYVVGDITSIGRTILELDPVARRWRDHLRVHPVPGGQRVIFDRFEVVATTDESAPLVEAAFMLDLKRLYMELRPALRRIYSVGPESFEGSAWEQLGFVSLPGGPTRIGATDHHTGVLDFGPASVDGWLTRVIATELRIEEDALLDVAHRQLVLRDGRVDLTRLEFEVLSYLYERPGQVVDRSSLLRDVWGFTDGDGSNVIEAQVKSLRRKLGPRATSIETVRGLGYRFVLTA